MRLTETLKKIKTLLGSTRDAPKDIFVFLSILLIGAGTFMIGRISVLEERSKNDLKIISPQELGANIDQSIDPLNRGSFQLNRVTGTNGVGNKKSQIFKPVATSNKTDGVYVGSISGHVYHLPSCPGARRIKDENKVWFKSKEEAESLGYKPAGNCKSI